jgi:plastocyanin
MKFPLGLLVLLLLAGCSKNDTPPASYKPESPVAKIDSATTSTISGVISFDGVPPKPQPIDMSQDPACVMGKVPPNFGEAYAVNAGHLQNVYVYIKDGLGNYSYAVPAPATLDQKGCRYVPHVLGLMVGQKLRILNSDPALHNIHSMPHENAGWNESQYPGGDALEKTFSKPELMIPIQCNNHPWMKMYVNVSTHPFFAVTDANGKFTISGLPPGTYTLAAVQEKMGEKTAQVTVGAKDNQTANFKFSPAEEK